jgi:integrase
VPKERSGTVWYDATRGCYRIKLTLNDGTRPTIDLTPTAKSPFAEARAREVAVERSKIARDKNLTGEDFGLRPPSKTAEGKPTGETVQQWVDRWLEWRSTRGLSTTSHDRGRLNNYVLPLLGPLPIRDVTRDDIERVVESLDRCIALPEDDKDRISWKTASNVWVLVTKAFKDSVAAKQRDIRVRPDDPSAGVAGPDHGDRKSKVYLYPSEFLQLVSSGIDIRFRILFAVAVYTFARAGELEALVPDDLDLEHGVLHINKAIDRETGKVKSTKGGEARRIPIEPRLAPLLKRLMQERTGPSLLWMPDNEDRAILLRQHLAQVGARRADLFADNDRQKHITFHDLRATGITWMAVRGDDPLRIKQRAGHKAFSTTEMYIREAENLAVGFGEPFPPLPPDLTGPIVAESSEMAQLVGTIVEQRGIEPRTSALRTRRSPS